MAQHLSREEFRRWAEKQDRRYERIAGEPVAMSPERIEHVRVKSRMWAALDCAIRAGNLPCEALGDGVTIEIDEDTDYEPDAVVNCGPPAPGDAVAATNPRGRRGSVVPLNGVDRSGGQACGLLQGCQHPALPDRSHAAARGHSPQPVRFRDREPRDQYRQHRARPAGDQHRARRRLPRNGLGATAQVQRLPSRITLVPPVSGVAGVPALPRKSGDTFHCPPSSAMTVTVFRL